MITGATSNPLAGVRAPVVSLNENARRGGRSARRRSAARRAQRCEGVQACRRTSSRSFETTPVIPMSCGLLRWCSFGCAVPSDSSSRTMWRSGEPGCQQGGGGLRRDRASRPGFDGNDAGWSPARRRNRASTGLRSTRSRELVEVRRSPTSPPIASFVAPLEGNSTSCKASRQRGIFHVVPSYVRRTGARRSASRALAATGASRAAVTFGVIRTASGRRDPWDDEPRRVRRSMPVRRAETGRASGLAAGNDREAEARAGRRSASTWCRVHLLRGALADRVVDRGGMRGAAAAAISVPEMRITRRRNTPYGPEAVGILQGVGNRRFPVRTARRIARRNSSVRVPAATNATRVFSSECSRARSLATASFSVRPPTSRSPILVPPGDPARRPRECEPDDRDHEREQANADRDALQHDDGLAATSATRPVDGGLGPHRGADSTGSGLTARAAFLDPKIPKRVASRDPCP